MAYRHAGGVDIPCVLGSVEGVFMVDVRAGTLMTCGFTICIL